ncbi:hypothetical protein GYMLUDRAFT_49440 [Collybiopsis luxurians FD-317 M1]|uniref:Uncharacterized protein n=1 Tax=Collybiopsis luxurians FD-317 M1 TaxID=944289 RepID=A0A0D0BUK5_9AGAR|nr:hypothetical protein GYMLUDRAFT_49440 [Collybiopsis luxurians FD-317 M1]
MVFPVKCRGYQVLVVLGLCTLSFSSAPRAWSSQLHVRVTKSFYFVIFQELLVRLAHGSSEPNVGEKLRLVRLAHGSSKPNAISLLGFTRYAAWGQGEGQPLLIIPFRIS